MQSYYHLRKHKVLYTEAAIQRCFFKVFWKSSQNSQEGTCARVSFTVKLQGSALQLYLKDTLSQVFCCEVFKHNFFKKTPTVAASVCNIAEIIEWVRHFNLRVTISNMIYSCRCLILKLWILFSSILI